MQIGPAAAARVALWAGLTVFTAAPSRSVPVTTLDIYENGVLLNSMNSAQLNCVDTGPGSAGCSISNVTVGDLKIASLGIGLFQDPEIDTSFGVQNVSGATQQFTLVFTMSVASIPGGSLTGGSVEFDFGDNTGDGVTLSAPPGSALYTAQIDAAAYQTLFPFPAS